jgi:hypothetical protein
MRPNPETEVSSPNFDSIIEGLWTKAKATKGNTRKCHYMPQFLMRRWAVNDEIRVQDIATGIVTTHRTKETWNGKKQNASIDVGFENDLYTTFDGKKWDRGTLEALFGQLESITAAALDGLERKHWILSDPDRETLSIFAAATALRLPHVLSAFETEFQPDFEIIAPGAKQIPGNTTHALLSVALKTLTRSFYQKHRWTIIRYPNDRQHTGDIPLIAATHDGSMISNNPDDWELRMPLDPHALLVTNGLKGPDTPLRPGTFLGPAPDEWNAPGAKRIL